VSDQDLRPLLLRTLAAAERRESAFVALCDDAPPADPQRWTAKDHLGHLSAWRDHAARLLMAASAGRAEAEPDDIDAQNARIHAANAGRHAADVVADAQRSYRTLSAAIGACSEAQLNNPRQERPGEVWRVVPGNGHPHVAQHLVQWYREHGDAAAAEATSRWMRELDDLFTDSPSRAAAAYNQACFYATAGDAEHALPLLRASLQIDPGLRGWIAQDSDLDPIRGDAAVRELLAAAPG